MEDYPVAPPLDAARAKASQCPDDAMAQWDLARAIADRDETAPVPDELLNEALAAADAAIRLKPDDARCHWTRGYLLQRWSARLARRATDSLKRAVELEPHRPKNHFQFIAAQRQAGHADHAVRYYLDRAKANPTDPAHYTYLAFAYYQARQYAEAVAAAQDGLRLAPGDALLWYVQGEGRVGRGEAGEAEPCLRKAAELDPSLVDAHYTLIDLLERQERWADVAAEVDALIAKLGPDDPAVQELKLKRAELPL